LRFKNLTSQADSSDYIVKAIGISVKIIEALRNKKKLGESADHSRNCNAQTMSEATEDSIAKSGIFERYIIVGCLVLIMFLFIINKFADSYHDKSTAYIKAQGFVANRLVSPSSARFPSRSEDGITVIHLGENRYSVSGYLDSQNTFGHEVRTHYYCIVRYTGTDEWVCEEISME
jgi:hypothetical protein